jgi:hypothetical protein
MPDSGATVSVGARVFNNSGTTFVQSTIVSTSTGTSKPANNIRVDGLSNNKYVICMTDQSD